MCPIAHTSKFRLSKQHSFHTIGSCFAREVEVAMTALGISLTAADAEFPWDWFDPRMKSLPGKTAGQDIEQTRQRSPLNRYSVHSILYDI